MIEFIGWTVVVICLISAVFAIGIMIKTAIGIHQINKEYDAMQKKYEKDQQEIIQSIRKDLAEFDKQFKK